MRSTCQDVTHICLGASVAGLFIPSFLPFFFFNFAEECCLCSVAGLKLSQAMVSTKRALARTIMIELFQFKKQKEKKSHLVESHIRKLRGCKSDVPCLACEKFINV